MDDAGLLSFATFSWFTPVMVKSYQHTLTVDTLPPLSPHDSSDTNAQRYQDSPGSPQARSTPGRGPGALSGVPFPTGPGGPSRWLKRGPSCLTWSRVSGGEDWGELVGRQDAWELWPEAQARGWVSEGLQGPCLGTGAARIPLSSVLGRPPSGRCPGDLLSKSPSD